MCLSETKTLYTYADTIEWYESFSARWVVYSVYGNGNQGHTAALVPLGTDIADHALCLQVLKSFKVSPSLWFGRVQRGDTVFLSQDGYTVEHVISKEWLAQEQAQGQAAEEKSTTPAEPSNEETKEEVMKYIVSYSSTAALQTVTCENGKTWVVIFMAEGKSPEVLREGLPVANNNHPEDLPMRVHACVNRRFGVVFALPAERRQSAIDTMIDEEIFCN